MQKFIVNVVLRKKTGMQYIPIRECDDYEEAKLVVSSYEKMNPEVSFCIDHL